MADLEPGRTWHRLTARWSNSPGPAAKKTRRGPARRSFTRGARVDPPGRMRTVVNLLYFHAQDHLWRDPAQGVAAAAGRQYDLARCKPTRRSEGPAMAIGGDPDALDGALRSSDDPARPGTLPVNARTPKGANVDAELAKPPRPGRADAHANGRLPHTSSRRRRTSGARDADGRHARRMDRLHRSKRNAWPTRWLTRPTYGLWPTWPTYVTTPAGWTPRRSRRRWPSDRGTAGVAGPHAFLRRRRPHALRAAAPARSPRTC